MVVEIIEAACEECGIIFNKQANNQRYCCPECRRIGQRRKSREYQRAKYVKKGQAKKKKAAKPCRDKPESQSCRYDLWAVHGKGMGQTGKSREE